MATAGRRLAGEDGRPRGRWWRRFLGGARAALVVLDRRLGERRHLRHWLARERRRGERRGLARPDLSAVSSHLGVGSRWQGELRFRGVLRIDGDLEGPRIRGGALIVGERARIQADLDVDLLLVCGQLQGEIRARQRVELRATSRVTGTIWAPRVEIWPGAVFRGTCHVGNETRALVEEWAGRRAVGTWIR